MADWKLVLRIDANDGEHTVWLDDTDGPRVGPNGIVIGSGGTPEKAYRSALGEMAAQTSRLCARIHAITEQEPR